MGKRANGEGSVYQRKKDGFWVASVTLDNGKRKNVYGKTQKEAIQAKQKLLQDKGMGIQLLTEDQTVETFLLAWLEDTIKPNLRPKTYLHYRLCVRHTLPLLGKLPLQKLTPQHLQRLYNKKREEKCSPQTVKHIHRMLHKALGDAVKWGLLSRNASDAVTAPRVSKVEMHVFTMEQAQQFLKALEDEPFEALFVLAILTGARQSELLALTWDDVDLKNGRMQIRRTLMRIHQVGFIVSEPKTNKSRRSVHLNVLAVEALKRHRLRQNELRLKAGANWDMQNLIFCNSLGRPLEATNMISRSFLPLLAKAGLPRIRFHDLRHTAASLLLSQGVHPKIVQELLGHSQIGLTMDTYSHVLPTLQEEAVNRLGDLLAKQG